MVTKIKILISVTVLLAPLNFLYAKTGDAEGAGAYLRMGVGARPLGMGGSFVALSNDVYATYWNPAGLTQLNSLQFGSMYGIMSCDRNNSFLNCARPFGKNWALGITWIGFGIDEIERRDSYGNLIGKLKDSQNSFSLSLAKEIIPSLSLGANLKYLTYQLDGKSASGFGFDIGSLLKPKLANLNLSLGLIIQDIGSHLKWNTESKHEDKFPLNIKCGGAIGLFEERLLLGCDVEKNEKQALKLHIGTEYWLIKTFALRVGYNDEKITTGAGFKISSFCIDYSFSTDKLEEGNIHYISILFSP